MANGTLDGKVALVTGGSRGIGAAVVAKLAAMGADVALTYRDGSTPADTVAAGVRTEGRRAMTIRADAADPSAAVAAVDAVVAAWGRLDIVVNNAGAFLVGPIEELTMEAFEQSVAVNLRAPFVTAQAAVRHLPAGGRIINIGSNVAERTVFPGFSIYSATKAALTGMTKSLGRELGPRAITVNLVNPGPTNTDITAGADLDFAVISGFTALGHFAEPADIAAAVAFLASPEARYITGATVNVDGGFTA